MGRETIKDRYQRTLRYIVTKIWWASEVADHGGEARSLMAAERRKKAT
jgi:hypothetical protein